MALSIVGTEATITEATGAARWARVNTPVCARRSDVPVMRVADTPGARTITIGPGAGSGTVLVAGVLVEFTTDEAVELAAVSGGSSASRTDVVCLRLRWAGLGKSRAEVVAIPASQITRKVGDVYDAALAHVTVTATGVAPGALIPVVPVATGGIKMILPAKQTPESLGLVEAHDGAELVVEATTTRYRRVAGSWRLAEDDDTAWREFDPVLSSSAGPVALGNGGISRGRYKLVGTRCLGEFEIRRGATGSNYGQGPLRFSLPHPASRYTTDQWFEGHLFTWREAPMDWPAHFGVPAGGSVATVFAPTRSDDCRMRAAQSKNSTNRVGTGIPQLNNDFSDPGVIAGVFDYVIEEPGK